MSILEAFRLALVQIWVQKLKSFFTLIGVTIGVTFLIAVVSIVGGMSRYVENDLVGKIIALNAFDLRREPNVSLGDVTEETAREWRRRPYLKESDVPAVAAALPADAIWSTENGGNLVGESRYGKPRRIQVSAVSSGWFDIKKMAIAKGRLITAQEFTLGSPVLVIGQDVAEFFFKNLDPLGRELRLRGLPYTVIGVAEKQGSIFGISLDKFVVAPEKSPVKRYLSQQGNIGSMTVQAQSPNGMIDAQERVRAVMRARHHLRPAQRDDFELETSASALAFWDKVKGYLVIAGVALPAIGLVVGAIVIMNIMLVAVAERTHEIGIRKSLGARRRDILHQFLVESATLSTLGATIGVILGLVFAKIIAAMSPLPAAVEVWSIFVGVGVGAGVGIIAGVYPASRASLLDPIAALRHET